VVSYKPSEHTRLFVYSELPTTSRASTERQRWENTKAASTPFNLEVTGAIEDGDNFLVVEVNNQRRADGVRAEHRWWNYGESRGCSAVEVPENFIRDYSIQLAKGRRARCGLGAVGWKVTPADLTAKSLRRAFERRSARMQTDAPNFAFG